MQASAVVAPGRFELLDVPSPPLGRHDVRIRPAAVGVCGTDFHIFAGESNFHVDAGGRPIPFAEAPQILGHEITGTVVEAGDAVFDLAIGDRVVVDQGRSCRSERREPPCEYCASGHSHQCAHYAEHGITGLPGGFAEELVVPAVNAVAIRSDLPFEAAALTEPLACVLHALAMTAALRTRYRLAATADARPVRTVVVLGAGPAGLLFTQVLRGRYGFDGPLIVGDPSPHKRALAEALGAIAVAPQRLEATVMEQSSGDRAELLVEATGSGSAFGEIPRLIRNQATVQLYGIGHGTAPLGLLTPLQWREATLVTSVGASGGFDADGRPSVYREALALLERAEVRTDALRTHRYEGLRRVPDAFAGAHHEPGYVKGVVAVTSG